MERSLSSTAGNAVSHCGAEVFAEETTVYLQGDEGDTFFILESGECVASVAEAPWSGAEWAVALRFDNP